MNKEEKLLVFRCLRRLVRAEFSLIEFGIVADLDDKIKELEGQG